MSIVLDRLRGRFPADVVSTHSDFGDDTALLRRERIVEVLTFLRDDPELLFDFAMDLTGVDYLGEEPRFEVVYHLYSDRHPAWLRIRVPVERSDPRAPSVTGIWPGAMFHEREMYDMMGIVFEGNRDLRRIYMSPDYRSFPQRKDFLLPDDAADSPAAGVNPLERPETWDLTVFTRELTSAGATYAPTSASREVPAEEIPQADDVADKSRPL